MADRGITQTAALCKFLLAQTDLLSEELNAKTYVFEELRFIFGVTFLCVYG